MSDASVRGISEKIANIECFQGELLEKLVAMEYQLQESSEEMCAVNLALREKKGLRSVSPSAHQGLASQETEALSEKLLQGSLEALGDQISQKLMNMMKELKGMVGPAREARIKEIQEAAQAERIDLANLFRYEERAESNLGQEGTEI